MAIAEKITTINNAINDIKENLGVSTSASLESLVTQSESAVIPTGSIDITENGTYDVSDKSSAVVNVSGGGDISEYFENTISSSKTNVNDKWYLTMIKKFPTINILNSCTRLMYAFYDYSISEINFGNVDTSNVTSMSYMFYNSKLSSIDLTKFTFEKCTNVSYMFYGCSKLTSIDLENKDLSKTTSYSHFCYSCGILTNIKLPTLYPTNLDYAFYQLKINDFVLNLNATNLTSMSYMLNGATGETFTINATYDSGSTAKSLNMSYCFNSSKYKTIDIGDLDFSGVTGYDGNNSFNYTFGSCSSLENLTFGTNLGAGYTSTTAKNAYSTLNLKACTKLTHDSLMDVINKLYDLASAGKPTQNLILGSTLLAKLSDDEKAIVTTKGWTLS